MESLEFKSIITGVLFGIWPLLMNRSGLGGNISTLVFASVVLLIVLPFSFSDFNSIANSHWVWAIAAGVFGALGLLTFNSILSTATPQSVGTFFVLMIVVQIAIPAIYHAILSGGLSLTKLAGFVFAAIASFLLLK